jgi:membrane protein
VPVKRIPVKRWLQLIRYVQQRYVADGCGDSAAALTYMTLFALVPLMTVMYAILSAVPAFQSVGTQVQEFIFNNFVPSTGQEVQDYLTQFSTQARKLTGVGVAFLGVTAILMLKNIEKTFNKIWHTRENRSGLASFLLYWAILSLGPLFIGLGLAINTYLVSLKVMFDQVDVIGIGPHLLQLTPYLLTTAAFTLMFAAVPNCKVPIRNAFTGGVITALVFELAKQLFASVVANTSYQSIYGTFAAVSLFLLWIYVSWQILLAGAELVKALGGFTTREDDRYSNIVIALAVLELLWRRYQQGQTVADHYLLRQPWLLDRHSLSSERWTPIRDKLFKAGLLRSVGSGDYVLGRDLNHFTLWDLIQVLDRAPQTPNLSYETVPSWLNYSIDLLADINSHNQQALSMSLNTLFETHRDTTTSP